ncbi:MAG: DNA polymerase III subunit alpha [Bacteroidetes bacterium]|nr:DNA polymerase III subunit alpha [Bacteroidota bacterium]
MFWNTHSNFSLRYGTLSLENIVMLAKKYNHSCIGLTDINNSTAITDFVKICRQNDIQPLAGIEFRNGDELLYTGLAINNEGFMELNDFLTAHNSSKAPLPEGSPALPNCFFIYPWGKRSAQQLRENEFTGVSPHDLPLLLTSPYRKYQDKLVARLPVTFHSKTGYKLHRHLRAIAHNTLLSKLEPHNCAHEDEYFTDTSQIAGLYSSYPQIIRNTEKIMSRCSIDFDYKTIKNKRTYTGNRNDDRSLLEKLANDGLQYRYGTKNTIAAGRIEKELETIDKLGFSSYFLITWDILRYSRSRNFHHVGRGSGANSIVAYCLGITDVDPIELDLYFERFINPKRSTPPDFDIDFSWKDRDEVFDYIFKRYGQKYTALIGVISTFKDSSIYRELGKVYGLPKHEIDQLADKPHLHTGDNDITMQIGKIAEMLKDFPNMRSIHSGGILVSEQPITCYTALDMPPKGLQTTQFDMYTAEDIGYEKLDILSQRGIGHIHDCISIVKENHGIDIDIHQVECLKRDKQVKAQLRRAESTGCFYIESPAMRGLLRKLKCDDYLTLVAASSIIRPGVARSGMMKEYIFRFHNPDKFEYIHPVMKKLLAETYGVMVYQEDVLKVCHHFAGLDLSEADILRRAMSGKFRGKKELERVTGKFFTNCRERGYPEEITKEVWRQIESFAGYSFSKAHSASYAVESFQSLFLKSRYPVEFMVAVINNFGGFYRTWVYFHEARRCGATIVLPCVNSGGYLTSVRATTITIGFIHLTGLESDTGQRIENERRLNGAFTGLDDFINRMQPSTEQLVLLIRSGSFRFTGKSKSSLLWEAHYLKQGKPQTDEQLFKLGSKSFQLPELAQNQLEDAWDEVELLGFPVTLSFFDMIAEPATTHIVTSEMTQHNKYNVMMLGNLITIKYVRTVKRETMYFGTFIDQRGEFFDTVHFPDAAKKYPFGGPGVYQLSGRITEEFGFYSLNVESMKKMALQVDPRGN